MKEIFDLFDSDGDELISSKNIDISKVAYYFVFIY